MKSTRKTGKKLGFFPVLWFNIFIIYIFIINLNQIFYSKKLIRKIKIQQKKDKKVIIADRINYKINIDNIIKKNYNKGGLS